jgi:O-antigen ligase
MEDRGKNVFCSLFVIAFLMLLQPWWRPEGLWVYDYSRWVEVVFLCFVIFASCFFSNAVSGFVFNNKFFISFFVLSIFSASILGDVGFRGWIDSARILLWLSAIVVLVSAFSLLDSRQLSFFSRSILIVSAVHILYSSVGGLALFYNGLIGADYLIDGFSNKNHAVAFYVPLLLLLPALCSVSFFSTRLGGGGVFIMGVFLGCMILVVGSRGGILSFFSALFLVAFLGRGEYIKKYLLWMAACFLVSLCLFLGLLWLHDTGAAEGALLHHNYASDSGRLLLWEAAWMGFIDSPWFGHGPLSYSLNRSLHVAHPHNFLFLLAYEYGVFLVVLVGVVAAMFYRMLWRERKRLREDMVSISGVAGAVAFMVHSLVGAGPLVPAAAMMFALSLAFIFSPLKEKIIGSDVGKEKPSFGRFITVGLFFIALSYVVLVFDYWRDLPAESHLEPRFWQFGELL